MIEVGDQNIVQADEPVSSSKVKLLAHISGRDVLAFGKNYATHALELNASVYDSSDKVICPLTRSSLPKDQLRSSQIGTTSIRTRSSQSLLTTRAELGLFVGNPGFGSPSKTRLTMYGDSPSPTT